MRESEKERILAECVEDYHQRRALGEPVRPEDWQEVLGAHYEEFQEIIQSASALDDLLNPVISEEKFPRRWGDYTLLRILGRGAMGIVYEAVERDLGRTVALKVLRAGYDDEPLAVERFQREAKSCAQVRHDGVVQILGFGLHEGRPYYAMPPIQGKNLQDLIKAGELPDVTGLAREMAGVADALAAIHDEGIVHRDVKPNNIMVDETGRMIVSDFGLARTAATETLTQTGQALGTPLYMSPEQFRGERKEIDARADVYGLGVSLYEALAGQPPFKADDYAALMRMVMTEQPRHLKDEAPDVPVDLANIAMKAMEKNKEDRYESAAAMRDDLLRFVEGRKVEGRPVSPFRRTWRRSKRVILLAASVILAAVLTWTLIPPRDAVLSLLPIPAAMATIDGIERGETPITLDVSAGEHVILFTKKGCEDLVMEISLRPGETRSLSMPLNITAGEDELILAEMGRHLGVRFIPLSYERTRGLGEGPAIQMLYPRGAVRVADLLRGAVEINDFEMKINGYVELRKNGEILLRESVPNDNAVEGFKFGEEIRAKFAPGDEGTWGYYPGKGSATVVDFHVVEDEVSGVFEEIDRMDGANVPEVLRRHLKAQCLFSGELYTGAYIAAREIALDHEGSARASLMQKRSLERIGVHAGWLSDRLLRDYFAAEAARKLEGD